MAGLGHPRVLLDTKRVIVPSMTLGLATGCYFWGLDGVAWAWLVTFPACYAYAFGLVVRAAGASYLAIFTVVRGPALAAGGMAVVVCFVHAGLHPVVDVGLQVLLGIGLYVALLRLGDPNAWRMIVSRFRRLVSVRPGRNNR